MTRGELVAEIIGARFDVSQTTSVQRWLDLANAWVWNAHDWSFKRSTAPVAVIVSAGQSVVPMPSDFGALGESGRVLNVVGDPLDEYAVQLFDDLYQGDAIAGRTQTYPEAFKIVNRQLVLGAAPTLATTIYIDNYVRRVGHLNNVGVYVAGNFVADTDTPVWGSEHHFVLVHAAVVIGLGLENDPTGGGVRDLRDEAVASMIEDYALDTGGVVDQWARWPR